MLCIYHQWIYSNNIKDNCQLPRYRENNLLALYIITQMFFSQLKVKHIDNSMDNYTFDVGIGYLCITTDCYSDICHLYSNAFFLAREILGFPMTPYVHRQDKLDQV